jgi:SAM-dependent methyltransferase
MDNWTRSEKAYFEETTPARLREMEREYIWHYPNVSFLFRRFEARVAGGPRLRILEIGCGPAVSPRRYFRAAGLSPFYLGADISSAMLSHAAKAFPGGHFIQCDLSRPLPLREGVFDFVVSLGVLHHLEDLAASLQAISALLQPGGEALLHEPNPHAFNFWDGTSPRERSVSPQALAQAAPAVGLAIVSSHRVNAPLFLRWRLWLRRLHLGFLLRPRFCWWLKHRLEVLWEPLGDRFPRLRGMNSYYVLKKSEYRETKSVTTGQIRNSNIEIRNKSE